ncbi:protein FAM53B isoform X2 [Coregonus clupeaformis]|nr:protein FAM53B isoform X2 [Coregonus clupeaformis]
MSLQGTALFSCGVMETGSRWRDVGMGLARGGCGALHHQRPSVESSSLENLWDVLPSEVLPHHYYQCPVRWGGRDAGQGPTSITSTGLVPIPAPGTITSLLQDLSLGEASAAAASSPSAAPPSKRQCRSLSCSEDLGGCRSAWRPQGSRVWTSVAKRRCHSGGSVQRGVATGGTRSQQLGFPAMQRSASFSLPARSNTLSLDLPGFTQEKCLPCPSSFSGLAPTSYSSLSSEPPRPFLYLSHGQICLPEIQGGPASPLSSPDSTPEMERRAGKGGLARSRSQPCVLNDKKMSVKRRRPADSHRQRPSLDLAKMTQKRRNFQSLSCPGITGDTSYQSTQGPPPQRTTDQCETDFASAGNQGLDDPTASSKEGGVITSVSGEEDPATSIEELDWLSSAVCDDVTAGAATGTRKDVYQLGGDLDIDQIERN